MHVTARYSVCYAYTCLITLLCCIPFNGAYAADLKEESENTSLTVHYLGKEPTQDDDAKRVHEHMVFLIHPYVQNDNWMLEHIAGSMQPHLSHTLFVAPDSPFENNNTSLGGLQWFPVDQDQQTNPINPIETAYPLINSTLNVLSEKHKIPLDKIFVVGYSQGAMIALQLMYSGIKTAGYISYAGALYVGDFDHPTHSLSPLLLIHGNNDADIPSSAATKAKSALEEHAADVTLRFFNCDHNHTVNEQTNTAALKFIQSHLKNDRSH